ncbi:hypothetical protein ACFL6W_03465 [Thermodesulfobacteriota bacterium]
MAHKNNIIYWVRVDAKLAEPITFDDEKSKKVHGFFREIGCTAQNENTMRGLVEDWVKYDAPELSEIIYEHIGIIALEDLQREIYEDKDVKESLLGHPQKQGIWYSTGRMFYDPNSDDDEFHKIELYRQE